MVATNASQVWFVGPHRALHVEVAVVVVVEVVVEPAAAVVAPVVVASKAGTKTTESSRDNMALLEELFRTS